MSVGLFYFKKGFAEERKMRLKMMTSEFHWLLESVTISVVEMILASHQQLMKI